MLSLHYRNLHYRNDSLAIVVKNYAKADVSVSWSCLILLEFFYFVQNILCAIVIAIFFFDPFFFKLQYCDVFPYFGVFLKHLGQI